ncbi:MAG TPA: formate hydrogenlyase [Firmicutes bacterium]|nr:formate hydrogenlyase [Bacillota bacterium]
MGYLMAGIIQLAVIIVLAPLVNGIIKKIKALSQKRKGAPLLQLYYDLYKLMKKDMVISETASWIFRVTPYIVMSSVLLAALLIPLSIQLQPIRFMGDVILVVYLLALGRFFMALTGLDTASTFGGMGSSREMMISSLIEPSLLVAVFTVGLLAGSTSVYDMMQNSTLTGLAIFQPVYILTFLALFIVLIAETARIPVDDPATHLELTMVHEAMLLEYSGRYLALMELSAAIKQLLLITILVNLFIPLDEFFHIVNPIMMLGVSLLGYLVKVVAIAVLIAIVEIKTVKLRLFSVPNLAALSFILALLGFFQYWIIGR